MLQLALPTSLQQTVLEGIHDASGNQGRSRTLALLRRRVFWPGMATLCWIVLCKLFKMLYCKGVETYSKADYGAPFGRYATAAISHIFHAFREG